MIYSILSIILLGFIIIMILPIIYSSLPNTLSDNQKRLVLIIGIIVMIFMSYIPAAIVWR